MRLYNPSMLAAATLLVSLAAAPHAQQGETAPTQVRAEFRIFSGTEEITASTRLRIMPTGTRERPMALPEGPRLVTEIDAGIYDVQALRHRQGAIVGIRWAERLVVMYYPDEDGRHLEVINFQPGYGALQLRAAKGQLDAYEVSIFPARDRTRPAASPVDGEDYKLFVVPAGRYDIRVRPAGASTVEEARWLLDIEVPADRTRIKTIGS
jgi:hypothetical protein